MVSHAGTPPPNNWPRIPASARQIDGLVVLLQDCCHIASEVHFLP
jgi:hypothetical protein